MKIPVIAFALAGLCLPFHTAVLAQTNDALVDKYYHAFKTPGDLAIFIPGVDFLDNVPPASQGEVLARMIDRASGNSEDYMVIGVSINFINNHSIGVSAGSHLERALLSQIKNPHAIVRAPLAALLSEDYPERYRAISLSFLDDRDDYVRYDAVTGVRNWKDAQDILKKYIQDHNADTGHERSIAIAKVFLKRLQEDLSGGSPPAIANAQSLGSGNASVAASAPTGLPAATTATLGCIHARAGIPVFQRPNSQAIAFFDKEYRSNGKYAPRLGLYLGEGEVEYDKGFNDGLTFALERFPNLGTDAEVKAVLKNNQTSKNEYQMGFLAAFEVCSAYQTFSVFKTAKPGAADQPPPAGSLK